MTRSTRLASTSAVFILIFTTDLPLTGDSNQQQSQQQQTSPPPQPPVFRAGAHFVRVDAYPSRDGQIIEGLTAADFEILEDGKPQSIETFEFIQFGIWTPEAERRDPNSQREGFDLAADPRYRVFVIYLDSYHVRLRGSHQTRQSLIDFLNRILGPNDLFGLVTPAQSSKDLLLGQKVQVIEEQLTRHWTWGTADSMMPVLDETEAELDACFNSLQYGGLAQALIRRKRLDEVFSDLEGLIALLGSIREERKNLILFSDGWTRLPLPDLSLLAKRGPNAERHVCSIEAASRWRFRSR